MQDGADHGRGGIACEGALAAEHFIQHTAESEQIGPGVGGLVLQLLRSHVLQCADDLVVPRERGSDGAVARFERAFLSGEPEIEQLDPLLREKDVVGLQIAMDDAFSVSRSEGVQDLIRVGDGFFDSQGAFHRLTFD